MIGAANAEGNYEGRVFIALLSHFPSTDDKDMLLKDYSKPLLL